MYNTLSKWHQGQAPQTMTYNVANRITQSTIEAVATGFTHDNAGNLNFSVITGVADTLYVWDPENRLIGIQYQGGALSTYTYQGHDGLRRSAWEPGGSNTTFVWVGQDYLQGRS